MILFLQCEYDESFFDDTPQIMPVREIYSTSLSKKGIRTRFKLGSNILLLAKKVQCQERSEENTIMHLMNHEFELIE